MLLDIEWLNSIPFSTFKTYVNYFKTLMETNP